MDTSTLMLVGYGVKAGAGIAKGMAAQEAGEFNAAGFETAATEDRAAAQRVAGERRRETERVISSQIARGAASGAGFGPSLLDVIGDTAARGEYQAQGEMYTGESRARRLTDRANISRWEGRNALIGSVLEGVGDVAMGAGRYEQLYGTSKRPPRIGTWRTTVSYG